MPFLFSLLFFFYLFFVSFLSLPIKAYAQTQAGFIKGTVTNSTTGAGVSGITITTDCNGLGQVTATTSSNGSYTINCGAYAFAGFWSVTETITVPSGMTSIASAPSDPQGAVTPGTTTITFAIYAGFHNELDFSGWNFALSPATSTISGNVFLDANKNGLIDGSETNYAVAPSISITPNSGTVTKNANGSYSITGLNAGTYTVSYGGPPSGYLMTSPLSNPPPSFQVTVGTSGCSVNGAPGATCNAGNITNLNFGITNLYPWFNSICGDVRNDNGIVDNLSSGQYLIQTVSPCSSSSLAFTGNINASLGKGQASSTNQIVGGANYPEVYPSSYSPLSTSYPSLLSKATSAGINPVDVTGNPVNCNLTSCTLPSNLTHGIYIANNTLTLNTWTAPSGNYIFLVNGDLKLNGPITVPVGSTVLFSVKGNITVNSSVGTTTLTSTAPSLAGWYVAGGSFILPSAGNCNDLRLNIAGSVVVDSLGTGGTFQNNRDLCGNDSADPTITFIQRLDMILNAPQFLQQQITLSREVSP